MALFDSQAALSHFSRNRRSHSRNFPQQREFLPQTNFHLLPVFVCHIIEVLRQNYVFKHQGGQKREVSLSITKTRSALLLTAALFSDLCRDKRRISILIPKASFHNLFQVVHNQYESTLHELQLFSSFSGRISWCFLIMFSRLVVQYN